MSADSIQIPGFEMRRLLGQGGMAKVYLAEQVSLDREVALKILSSDLIAGDENFCKRFLTEGQIIARLHHQHIVTIHDIGCTADNVYYMAMEYCPEGTLSERIRRGMSIEQAVAVICQIAAALGYAHDKGFVHRDIKPGNILFRNGDEAILSDFGIAKPMDARTRLTQAGLAIGTPEYMSPEQATGGKLGAASDLYSLGVVLYEMLLGKKPFVAPDAVAVALMHVQAPIPRLPSEFAALQHVFDGLLAKQVEQRIGSASALIEELDRLDIAPPEPPAADLTQVLPTRAQEAITGRTTRKLDLQRTGKTLAWVGFTAFLLAGAALLTRDYLQGEGVPDVNEQKVVVDTERQSGDEVSAAIQERVRFLLEVAAAHTAVGRVHEPKGSNAVEAYQLVLELDPNNRDATDALIRLNTNAQ